ncbi:Calcium-independent phospholipase A2-gamma [Paramyrothecium foliicola]|nr:Calcium-independent phospholipase A2-gamma [Paramyrothecium foliicola]
MPKSCECDKEEDLVFCTGCNEYYCESCWGRRRAHKDKNSLGPGGIPHEKVDPEIVESVNECMAEPEDENDEKQQHEDDQDTTWFGLDRDMGGEPVLSEYRRYAAIMMDGASETTSARYPGLVSFVGQTGAGKSTLIRLLIDPKRSNNGQIPLAAPVLGRSDCELPTSADVHLYADPKTFSGAQPILFADCEGFDGGERDPIAAASSRNIEASSLKRKPVPTGGANGNSVFRRVIPGTKRILRWARRDAPNHEKTAKRQYAIAEMYPRIFYAFSDVIVFVLNNPKTMEDVVEKLLIWADTNYSKSINLPSKPHAIIALNKCNNSTPESLWNHFTSTDEFFRSMNSQIKRNKTFQAYVKKWQSANFRISDMDELFGCYYSSVHVIRIPDKSRYQLLSNQRDDLYSLIIRCCNKAFIKKKDNRMLPDVDEFGLCLSLAFDHFSQTLDEPFDYVQASLKYKPPPETMADNLHIFSRLVGQKLGLQGQIEPLFNKLTHMVASCLMLDSVRNRRFGQPEDWFRAGISSLGPECQLGTGGIISLGFGHELWSVDECIEKFKSLVVKVFTKRRAQKIQGLRYVEVMIKKSRYETKPLEDALRATFGEDKLFGKREKNGVRRLKVAVTAVSEAGQRAYVLSNYNVRNYATSSSASSGPKLDYQRYRTQRPEDELKVWEAARGTSAAPGFFKPFAKTVPQDSSSHRFPELLDGALRHNNPIYLAIEETRRLATAQNQHVVPDVVLSLGTGLPKHVNHEEDVSLKFLKGQADVPYKKQPFLRAVFTMISYQIKLNLDTEDRWKGWSEPLKHDPMWRDRLFRLNPDLGEQPPPMDDVSKVQSLQNNVIGWIETNIEARDLINEVVCSLVASCFYFERKGNAIQVRTQPSSIELHGCIRCRFWNSASHLKALGAFLATCQSRATFVIANDASEGSECRLPVEVAEMQYHGRFKDVPVVINVPTEDTTTRIAVDLRGILDRRRMYNISGFPRQLMRHDFLSGQPKQRQE